MRHPKQAIKAFFMISLGGPFLVGLTIFFLMEIFHHKDGLDLIIYIKGVGALLFFVYGFGIVPALVAGFGVAFVVYRRGQVHFLWLPLIAFGAGFVVACLMVLPRKGFAGLLSALDVGIFLGLCGLLASVLLLPFLWWMKVVGK